MFIYVFETIYLACLCKAVNLHLLVQRFSVNLKTTTTTQTAMATALKC